MSYEQKELERILRQLQTNTIESIGGNMVGRVVRVNAKTIDVQPVINKVLNGKSVKFPVLAEVPPIFISGGSSYETFPIAVGDYCLLVISESCFDTWYNGNDEFSPLDSRRFDYSDCFALVGLYNKNGALDIPDIITRKGDSLQKGNHELEGNLTLKGDKNQEGNSSIIGNVGVVGNVTITDSEGGAGVLNGDFIVNGSVDCDKYKSNGDVGVSGTWTGSGGATITFTNGIVTGFTSQTEV